MPCRLLLFALLSLCNVVVAADPIHLTLRYRQETADGTERFHTLQREEQWQPGETALILCDVWDSHHSHHAVLRVNELVPRLNEVTSNARNRGVTIIHAPSSCMEFYKSHAARLRAQNMAAAGSYPDEIGSWCYKIPSEEQGAYPIDQTDGGCDDEEAEHAAWLKELEGQGRNPKAPWVRQHAGIEIDPERDFISDQGKEIWNILEARGIKNVILAGVHTNMCVLGRPFGLRQMARNGKNAVLMRDMTDTMYNPKQTPFVSHFTGTDLIVEHIEKWVCPTITSTQFIGGEDFKFKNDQRPHVVIISAESEYKTEVSLPKFAAEELGRDFKVSFVFDNAEDRNDIPGLFAVESADVLFVSVRRRTLPSEQLAIIRKHITDGKPVVGIRTASHAFCLRNQPAPEGLADWPEFDAEVFGGSYANHHNNKLQTTVHVTGDGALLDGIDRADFLSGGSLYMPSPLAEGCQVLMTGTVVDADPEPVAWTFTRQDGGKSFYTSLGHVSDFEQPSFRKLLLNGLHWAAQQ
ncbi:MAG: isochorismatase family protein [Planctomycetaceae bacterium]|nr:isochorismatase family protein [Planctomycetaceae bacterium]